MGSFAPKTLIQNPQRASITSDEHRNFMSVTLCAVNTVGLGHFDDRCWACCDLKNLLDAGYSIRLCRQNHEQWVTTEDWRRV